MSKIATIPFFFLQIQHKLERSHKKNIFLNELYVKKLQSFKYNSQKKCTIRFASQTQVAEK